MREDDVLEAVFKNRHARAYRGVFNCEDRVGSVRANDHIGHQLGRAAVNQLRETKVAELGLPWPVDRKAPGQDIDWLVGINGQYRR